MGARGRAAVPDLAVHPGGGRDTTLAYLLPDGAHLVPVAIRARNSRRGAPDRSCCLRVRVCRSVLHSSPVSSAHWPAHACILGPDGTADERRWPLASGI